MKAEAILRHMESEVNILIQTCLERIRGNTANADLARMFLAINTATRDAIDALQKEEK